ncbi:MAG UNVERIFIED_CONTAM: hypothetical protein LVT10_05015 [Anaerolineae bacterium]|jgi:hypothetical protein
MNKLTVKDLFELRKERTLIQIYADSPQEAAACEAAGIEMVMTSDGSDVATFRKAAPNVLHCHMGCPIAFRRVLPKPCMPPMRS